MWLALKENNIILTWSSKGAENILLDYFKLSICPKTKLNFSKTKYQDQDCVMQKNFSLFDLQPL